LYTEISKRVFRRKAYSLGTHVIREFKSIMNRLRIQISWLRRNSKLPRASGMKKKIWKALLFKKKELVRLRTYEEIPN
jgi:hypothetical protein